MMAEWVAIFCLNELSLRNFFLKSSRVSQTSIIYFLTSWYLSLFFTTICPSYSLNRVFMYCALFVILSMILRLNSILQMIWMDRMLKWFQLSFIFYRFYCTNFSTILLFCWLCNSDEMSKTLFSATGAGARTMCSLFQKFQLAYWRTSRPIWLGLMVLTFLQYCCSKNSQSYSQLQPATGKLSILMAKSDELFKLLSIISFWQKPQYFTSRQIMIQIILTPKPIQSRITNVQLGLASLQLENLFLKLQQEPTQLLGLLVAQRVPLEQVIIAQKAQARNMAVPKTRPFTRVKNRRIPDPKKLSDCMSSQTGQLLPLNLLHPHLQNRLLRACWLWMSFFVSRVFMFIMLALRCSLALQWIQSHSCSVNQLSLDPISSCNTFYREWQIVLMLSIKR